LRTALGDINDLIINDLYVLIRGILNNDEERR